MCFFKKSNSAKKTEFANVYEQHLPATLNEYLQMHYGLKVQEQGPQLFAIVDGTLAVEATAAQGKMPAMVSIRFEYKKGDRYHHGTYIFSEQNWFYTRKGEEVRGNAAANIRDMEELSAKECHKHTSKETTVVIKQLGQFKLDHVKLDAVPAPR